MVPLAPGPGHEVVSVTVSRRPRLRRIGPALGIGLLVLAVLVSLTAAWALPVIHLGRPRGPAAVGATVLQWQHQRSASGPRTVVAQVWYPAAPAQGTSTRPYLGRDAAESHTVAAGLAATYGLPAWVLAGAEHGTSTSVADAAVATGQFPVVLFSPGLAGVRTQNSAWAEDLASRGHVVVALDHPGDSAVMVLNDGTAVTSTVRSTGDDAKDEANTDRWTNLRVDDLRAAIDELPAANRAHRLLQGHLDLTRVVAAGHSVGGAAALLTADRDRRVTAVVNLDGLPRGAAKPVVPVLTLVAGHWTGDAAGAERYAARLDATTSASRCAFRLTVPGVAHLGLTDAALFLPPLPSLVGPRLSWLADRRAGISASSTATQVFLDHVLRGVGSSEQVNGELAQLGPVSETCPR